MKIKFADHDAIYESDGDFFTARLVHEKEPKIFAASFVHAKAAVKARIKRERDLAWDAHAAQIAIGRRA